MAQKRKPDKGPGTNSFIQYIFFTPNFGKFLEPRFSNQQEKFQLRPDSWTRKNSAFSMMMINEKTRVFLNPYLDS